MSPPPDARALLDAAARRYERCGRFCRGFVRGKLRGDPVYRSILALGWIPGGGALVDLGCGRGILLSLVAASRDPSIRATWPAGWAPAPDPGDLRGIEGSAARAVEAKSALGNEAAIETADLRTAPVPSCRAAVLLDVLHYLDARSQEDLLDRVAAALEPEGVLVIRDVDDSNRPAAAATRLAERAAAALRGRIRPGFHFRKASEWRLLLESKGFEVESRRADENTPFSNALFRARRRASGTISRSRHGGGGALGGPAPAR